VIHRLIRWRVLRSLDRAIAARTGGSTELIVGSTPSARSSLSSRLSLPAAAAVKSGYPASDSSVTPWHHASSDRLIANAAGLAIRVETFEIEPLCWWPDGLGGQLKPDAYVTLVADQVRDHWWIEVDRATESLPTLTRKLGRYVDFARRGQLGLAGGPRVLVSVISDRRLEAVRAACDRLPDPAPQQIVVVRDRDAALAMLGRLRE